MPTPPLSDQDKRDVVNLWMDHGRSVRAAAAASGMNYNTYKYRLDTAKRDGYAQSKGVASVISKSNLLPAEARGGWIHAYDDDGKKIAATRWANQDDAQDSEDRLAAIRAAFEGMTPAEPVIPPDRVADDLCNLFPLYDVHFGMHAWGKETGGDDYDIKLAERDIVAGFERVLNLAPMAEHGVLLIGGDFFHADDNTAQTPASHHQLDVDGRMFKVLETAVRVLSYVIGRIQSRHRKTTVRVLRGNHDEHSHMVLTFALAERFGRDSSIDIQKDPRDLFMFQWGRAAIFAHHGDKQKPVDLVLKLADACPFWSQSPHRYAYTGHRHKLAADRIGGVYWEQLDPFCPPDSYGSTWTNRRGLRAETFHRHSGRVLTAHDPLERAA